MLSSAIGTAANVEALGALAARVGVPTVAVGLPVPGIPGVLVRGSDALAALIRHLIEVHGSRRIAMIGGLAGHYEAREREAVFRAELAAAGLEVDEALVVEGTFHTESGAAAARKLLRSGRPFDTVVCMNDRMAVGALAVFREAGLQIPEDLRVTGFDDISAARWESPPLSTVSQPLANLGRQAVDLLDSQLLGSVAPDRDLGCQLVLRESCGCPPRLFYPGGTEVPDADLPSVEALAQAVPRGTPAFLAELGRILAREQGPVDRGGQDSDRLARWHHGVRLTGAPAPLLEEASALISRAEIRRQASARLAAEAQHRMIRDLSARLAGSFGTSLSVRRLAEGLESLKIRHGFLAVAQGSLEGAGSPVRLLMAHGLAGGDTPAARAPFAAGELLPSSLAGVLAGRAWVLEPLVFQAEVLGYLLLEADDRDPAVYENLRDQVSSTLKGTLLLERIRGHEAELESQVSRRTEELRRANRDLTALAERRRVLQQEVQEISDKTMQSIGQDLHDDLCQHLAGIGMFASVLEGDLREAVGDEHRAVASVAQVRRLIDGAVARTRQIARGLFPPGLEDQGLAAILEDLIETLRRTGRASIAMEAETDFAWLTTAQKAQVFRIIQEALSNAMRHSGSEVILVRLVDRDGWAAAEVRDFGRGLPPVPGGGMGLRIMAYRAESIGASLSIENLDPGVCIACRMEHRG